MPDRPFDTDYADYSLRAVPVSATPAPSLRRQEGRGDPPGPDRNEQVEEAPGKDAPGKDGPGDDGRRKGVIGWVGRHRLATLGIGLLLAAAIVAGILWWLDARRFATTDDAFIDGRPVGISAQVAGTITEVPVSDNQLVEAGAVLARIDDRDYRASQESARAQIAQAEAGIANADAQMAVQQAAIEQAGQQATEAQAGLSFAKDENIRYRDLLKTGTGTVQRAQQAASDLQQKQAALDAALAARVQSEKQIGVLDAQRKTAAAQLLAAQAQADQAQANLSRVVLTAPVRGRVTRLTGAAGAYAAPGQALMMLVPADLWVTANYKETQLAGMHPGQAATIRIDAYRRAFPAHVDSIQAGSGTAFSLLPAQNATGNYVKVVQRVPVKLVFDQPPDLPIGLGMSVVPSVTLR